VVIVVLVVGLSFVTKQASDQQVAGLTYGSISKEQRKEIRDGIDKWDIIHTVIILGITAAIYIRFF